MAVLERAVARDAITQMLADAGINRETITEMLNEVIERKVQDRLDHIMRTKSNEIERYLSDRYDKKMQQAITDQFQRAFPYAKIQIVMAKEPVSETAPKED